LSPPIRIGGTKIAVERCFDGDVEVVAERTGCRYSYGCCGGCSDVSLYLKPDQALEMAEGLIRQAGRQRAWEKELEGRCEILLKEARRYREERDAARNEVEEMGWELDAR